MTDTPIYDQIRKELRDKPDIGDPKPRTRQRSQPESREASAGAGVSVWALIDEHRSQRPGDAPSRRRP
ncbi:hypothetical protein [Actinokineospora iranica]|uniref:Uncharacterized protein n=1 Tax=Actinokineospora iranica TaxID=1271860 RepID=A0A1G6LK15_9PSEU|nr:hypothetical protein [Actinokineospora iranica]SDC43337.1 hypothetical protein SAMN05216174_102104 [Actinokineospora iranica]